MSLLGHIHIRVNTSDTKLHFITCLNYAHTTVLLMIKSMCRTNTRVFQCTNFIFLYSQDFLKATFLCVNLLKAVWFRLCYKYSSAWYWALFTVFSYFQSRLHLLITILIVPQTIFIHPTQWLFCLHSSLQTSHAHIYVYNTHHSSLILWNVLR